MPKKRKCTMRTFEKKKCPHPVFITFPVTIFHPDSKRESEQTWEICLDHLIAFLRHPWNFKAVYHRKRSPGQVIGYKLPMITGNFEVSPFNENDPFRVYDYINECFIASGQNAQDLKKKFIPDPPVVGEELFITTKEGEFL